VVLAAARQHSQRCGLAHSKPAAHERPQFKVSIAPLKFHSAKSLLASQKRNPSTSKIWQF
jgi:hypothetical protein